MSAPVRSSGQGESRTTLGIAVRLLCCLIMLLGFSHHASAGVFSRTFGGEDGERILDIREAANGELLVAAWTDSFGTQTADAWVLRLDADGVILDQDVHGNSVAGGAAGAVLEADGSAVFVGRNVVDIFAKHDAWVHHVDATGAVTWSSLFATGLGRHSPQDVVAVPAGGYAACGTTSVNDFPPIRAWLFKLEQDGTLEWQYHYEGGGVDSASTLVATADGGYLLAGSTTSSGEGGTDALVMKVDAAGALVWQKTFGGSSDDEATSVVELSDGRVAVSAVTTSFSSSGRAGWILVLGADGTLDWQKVVGQDTWCDFQGLTETADGELLAIGRLGEPCTPGNDLWGVKADVDDGSILWQRAYQGDSGDWGEDALQLANGELLMAAQWGAGFADEACWLLRTSADGVLGCPLERTTSVVDWTPRIGMGDGVLVRDVATPSVGVVSFTSAASSADEVVRCDSGPWQPLTCDSITVDPLDPCEGTMQSFRATASGGQARLSFEWDVDGDLVPDLAGNPVSSTLPPGQTVVTVFVTDSCSQPKSCQLSVPVDVHPNPDALISASGPLSFCAAQGGSVTLSTDEPPGGSLQWALDGLDIPGAVMSDLLVVESGSYTVTVTSDRGCSASSEAVVVDAELCPCETLVCDSLSIDPQPVCLGEEQRLSVSYSGGEGSVSVEWDLDGDDVVDDAGNPLDVTLPAGSVIVTAFVTDECGSGAQTCRLSLPNTVHPDQTPVLSPDGPTSFCASDGENVSLDAGAGHASYQWMRDGLDLPGEVAETHVATLSGSYSVRVVDTNGCTWTSEAVVVDAEQCECEPLSCGSITVSPPAVCDGEMQELQVAVLGGDVPLSHEWDLDGDTLPDQSGNPISVVLPVGEHDVTVTVTDGCLDPGEQQCSAGGRVIVHPEPTVTITYVGPPWFCAMRGETRLLEVAEGPFASYQWSLDGMDVPGATAASHEAGATADWAVRIVDGNGCVAVSPPVTLDAEQCACEALVCGELIADPIEVCEGESVSFEVTTSGGEGLVTYDWDFMGMGDWESGSASESHVAPVGSWRAYVTVMDSCTDPGAATCPMSVDYTVHPGAPGELSDVLAGQHPLRVLERGERLTVSPGAELNVYVDVIGSWYEPTGASGSSCHLSIFDVEPDGSRGFDFSLPSQHWVLVNSVNGCGEGELGSDSLGSRREDTGSWEFCGPLP